jgi:CrcB protein
VRSFALVAAGGFAGTLARHGIGEWLNPEAQQFPVGTFVVNVSGSFLLGVLLTLLILDGDDTGSRRTARLLLGTGVLGGYTTYSALAVETQQLLRDEHVALGLTYASATLAAGLLAALTGIATGRSLGNRAGGR